MESTGPTEKVVKALINIQSRLNAPKSQRNKFGNYNYRSCEDILQAVKPLLADNNVALLISDQMLHENDGGGAYVRAKASITDGKGAISVEAYAKHPESKKGMDPSQITGATSSYARKYALNGLFRIDDNKDADSMDNRDSGQKPSDQGSPAPKGSKPSSNGGGSDIGSTLSTSSDKFQSAIDYIKKSSDKGKAFDQVMNKYGGDFSENQKKALAKFKG